MKKKAVTGSRLSPLDDKLKDNTDMVPAAKPRRNMSSVASGRRRGLLLAGIFTAVGILAFLMLRGCGFSGVKESRVPSYPRNGSSPVKNSVPEKKIMRVPAIRKQAKPGSAKRKTRKEAVSVKISGDSGTANPFEGKEMTGESAEMNTEIKILTE